VVLHSPGMESTPSNLPQVGGVGGTQVPIGQPFHAYTPSSHATGTQMAMGPPYQVYHPGGTQMPIAPTYSQQGYPPPLGANPYVSYQYPTFQQPVFNRQLPFLETLDLPDLSRLTNDPIFHSPFWPPIPAKLPSDIPKFDGKPGEDPSNHVMTYHLWCSSNSLNDDSIHLHLFQCTLTGSAAKWYIELQ
jgi:hypothetical protein